MTQPWDVAVIGDGVAGVAAAFSAARAGARTILVSRGNGATTLSSGCVDRLPWDAERGESKTLIDDRERRFLDAMEIWEVGDSPVRLATLWGAVRPSLGKDRALLDLEAFERARVLVPRADRPGWDADALARTWSEQPWCQQRHIEFVPIDASLIEEERLYHASDAEFALAMDGEGMRRGFSQRLKQALAGVEGDAVLVGPWLGLEPGTAAWIAQDVGMPVGETLTFMGGTAGARFERASSKLLDEHHVDRRRVRVKQLHALERHWELGCTNEVFRAKAVVVACGAFVGGGLTLTLAEEAEVCEVPRGPTKAFALSFEGPLCLVVDGRVNDIVASMQGLNLERLAWPRSSKERWILDRVNVFHDGVQALEASGDPVPGVFVAGEIAHDTAQSMLSSMATGLQAGEAAARFVDLE